MALPSTARTIVVQNHIQDSIVLDGPDTTFAIKTSKLPSYDDLPADSVLIQTLYLSNDPSQRIWVQKGSAHQRSDMTLLPSGSPMKAFTISKVLAVGSDRGGNTSINAGDLVLATSQWSDYVVLKKSAVTKIKEIPGASPSAWLGALGNSGWTAYWGLIDVLKPKRSDTLVISGAAGGVGNVVVQLAKNVVGVHRVIAIAGSSQSPDFVRELEGATPDGVDLFFDNVGGKILDEVILRMKPHGQIAACGAMASYENRIPALENYTHVVMKSLHLHGFTIMDYMDRVNEATDVLVDGVQTGKIDIKGAEMILDVQSKLEDIRKGLFDGINVGKLVTKM